MSLFFGYNNQAKKIEGVFVGVDGVAKKIEKIFVGVNGVAKEVYSATSLNYTELTVSDAGNYTLNIYKEDTEPTNIYVNNVLATTSTTSGSQDINVTVTDSNSVIKVQSNGNWYFDSYSLGSTTNNNKLTALNTTNENKMTKFGHSCFWNGSFSSITIPSSVTEMKTQSIFGCDNLTSLTIPKNVTTIQDGMNPPGTSCPSITTLSVESGNSNYHSQDNCIIKTSTNELIVGCKNSIIPSDGSVTAIGMSAFSRCTGLTSINIPDTVTNIKSNAFYNCSNLTSVSGGNNITNIDSYAFSYGPITSFPFTANMSIGNNAFSYSGFTSLNLPRFVQLGAAFRYCASLQSVILNTGDSGYESIEALTFEGCSSLSAVSIGNHITSIGYYSFRDCTSLSALTVPSSVMEIGYGITSGCSNLTTLTVDSENTTYHSSNNCIIQTDTNTLIAGCKNSIIPTDGSVTSIYQNAFLRITTLTLINIPDTITSIRSGAFGSCTRLTTVTMNSATPPTLANNVFNGCTALTTIYVPYGSLSEYQHATNWSIYADKFVEVSDTLFTNLLSNNLTSITANDFDAATTITNYAFVNCTNLTSICIPTTITSISANAFDGCTGLTTITLLSSTPPTLYSNVFDTTSLTKIYIPSGSLNNYTSANYWSYYTDYFEEST